MGVKATHVKMMEFVSDKETTGHVNVVSCTLGQDVKQVCCYAVILILIMSTQFTDV